MLTDKMVNTEGIEVISYGREFGHFDDKFSDVVIQRFWNNQSIEAVYADFVFSAFGNITHHILSDQTLIAQLRALKPDLFVVTNFPPFRNVLTLPYMLDVPFVTSSPFCDYIGARIPVSLSAVPTQINGDFHTDGMSLYQRLVNGLSHFALIGMHYYVTSTEFVAKCAPNRPLVTTDEILRKAELFIVETDHIMD